MSALRSPQEIVAGASPVPLLFQATKSQMGHSECAAGAVGLLQTTRNLNELAAFEILHLRTLNPHVESAIAFDAKGSGHGVVAANRTPAALPCSLTQDPADESALWNAGVSAFAFQGTNAFSLIGRAPTSTTEVESGTPKLLWDMQRFSIFPEFLPFASEFLGCTEDDELVVEVALHTATIQSLDHQVSGKALFPGAGYMEVASEVLHMLTSSAQPPSEHYALLTNATIPAPLVIDDTVRDGYLRFHVSLDIVEGSISISSGDVVHFRATIEAVPMADVTPDLRTRSVMSALVQDTGDLVEGPVLQSAFATFAPPLASASSYLCDPAISDGALQLGAVAHRVTSDTARLLVPAEVGAVLIQQQAVGSAGELWTGVSVAPQGTGIVGDFKVAGLGTTACIIERLQAKPMRTAAANKALRATDFLFELEPVVDNAAGHSTTKVHGESVAMTEIATSLEAFRELRRVDSIRAQGTLTKAIFLLRTPSSFLFSPSLHTLYTARKPHAKHRLRGPRSHGWGNSRSGACILRRGGDDYCRCCPDR